MIVVTGATGFVGRYLVDHLVANREEVIACGRTNQHADFFRALGVRFVHLDVTDPGQFAQLPVKNVTAVVHLAGLIPAAVQDVKTDLFIKVNTLGTFNALEYARKSGIPKFLFTTTLYECTEHTALPISEAMGRNYSLVGDHAAYVISKIAAAEYVEHYRQEYGLQGIVFRFTGLLGLGRQEGYFADGVFHPSAFEAFYQRSKAGQPLEIWGEHTAKRDALYVKDAVRAIYMAIRSDKAKGLYVIGSGEGRSVEDEVHAFASVFGTLQRPLPVVYRPEKEDKKKSYYFDIRKAKRDFGWEPQYAFADVLRDYDREVLSGRFRPGLSAPG
jgi:UDP-glucose 4-epimerase